LQWQEYFIFISKKKSIDVPSIPTYGAIAKAFINVTTLAVSLRKSTDRRADAARIHSVPCCFAFSSAAALLLLVMVLNNKFDCNRANDCNSDRTNSNAKSLSVNSLTRTRRSRPCADSDPPSVPVNSPRNIRTMEPLLVRVRRGLPLRGRERERWGKN
jgi:hypothetical protein